MLSPVGSHTVFYFIKSMCGYKPCNRAKKPTKPEAKCGAINGCRQKMRKKLLLTAAVVLLVVIAVPVAVAAVQQNQTIYVTKTYTAPLPTSSQAPVASAAPTSPPPAASTVKYSLWYPNGTAYNLHQENTPSVFGATNLDTNGVPVNVQTGLGAPPMGYASGVIVVRNDGDVSITVNATLANVSVPSDVILTSTCNTINPATWGSQVDGWMGRGKLATGGVLGVGEYAWLSVQVIMTNSSGNMGAIQSHSSFSYSFDVAVTAAQA
jgi:hypothetical protein